MEGAFTIFEGSWASEIPGYGFGATKGKVEFGAEDKKHPHGPCMTLFASRG
jgi:hypothetical protein